MGELVTLADGVVLDVALWPLPDGVADGVLNRGQLAQAFSVSENTITKWMSLGMPVLTEGQNGVAYEFKLSHCWAWRQSRDDQARATKARGDALAAQAALAFRNLDDDQVEKEGDLTAQELRAWSEAEYHRNKVAEQRLSLVRADRVQILLDTLLTTFRTSIYTIPDFSEREFGLSAAQVAILQARCDEVLVESRNEIERAALGKGSVVVLPPDDQGQFAL